MALRTSITTEEASHALGCRISGSERTRRHTLVSKTLQLCLEEAGVVVKSEPFLFKNSREHPDLLATTDKGEIAIDLTITEALCKSHRAKTAKKAMSASDVAIKSKEVMYAKRLKDLKIDFLVVPMESTGGLHPLFQKFVVTMSRTNDVWSEAQRIDWVYNTYKRCTFALIRGNGRIIRHWARAQRMEVRVA